MISTDSPLYQKAFENYLRKGTLPEVSIKAMLKAVEHPTRYYTWRTAADDKVRASHAANEGLVFAWDNPPDTGNPGDDFNCRCTAEPYYGPYDPPIEPVYPELLLIPWLRIPRLIEAWRLWILQRRISKTWQLGTHKTPKKWANRMEKGNWTPQKISEVIKKGTPYKAPNKVNEPNTATRYELNGEYVVVDDVTKEVLQVGERGYIPNELPN